MQSPESVLRPHYYQAVTPESCSQKFPTDMTNIIIIRDSRRFHYFQGWTLRVRFKLKMDYWSGVETMKWPRIFKLLLGSGRKDRPYDGEVRPTGELSMRVIRENGKVERR